MYQPARHCIPGRAGKIVQTSPVQDRLHFLPLLQSAAGAAAAAAGVTPLPGSVTAPPCQQQQQQQRSMSLYALFKPSGFWIGLDWIGTGWIGFSPRMMR